MCVSPALQDYYKDELAKSNASKKEQRKAREERAAAKKGAKGAQGSGQDDK